MNGCFMSSKYEPTALPPEKSKKPEELKNPEQNLKGKKPKKMSKKKLKQLEK